MSPCVISKNSFRPWGSHGRIFLHISLGSGHRSPANLTHRKRSSRNQCMIAPGNHFFLDALRAAPPQRGGLNTFPSGEGGRAPARSDEGKSSTDSSALQKSKGRPSSVKNQRFLPASPRGSFWCGGRKHLAINPVGAIHESPAKYLPLWGRWPSASEVG